MGCYSRYHAGRLLHFSLCILSWRRSWDGGVQKTSQVRRVVGVVRVPADCFGNFGPNQRISCAVFKWSGPENHLSLPMTRRHNPTTLYRSAEIRRHLAAWVIWKWCWPGSLADQLFLTCLAFNPQDPYYQGYKIIIIIIIIIIQK